MPEDRVRVSEKVELWTHLDHETMEYINHKYGADKEYERQAAFDMWIYFGNRFPELMEKLGLKREIVGGNTWA
jgi:hypothetical protein